MLACPVKTQDNDSLDVLWMELLYYKNLDYHKYEFMTAFKIGKNFDFGGNLICQIF